MAWLFHQSRALRPALLIFLLVGVSGCVSQEDRARSYYERGLKFISEHNNPKAAIELRNAVRLKSDFIDAWKLLAETDEANNDWPHVASDLRTITALAPDDVPARLKLGKLLLLTGSANEAFALAEAGLRRDDRNADLHALKAAIALKLGDRAGAVDEARSALALDAANADAVTVLAIDRLGTDNAKGALSLLESFDGTKTLEKNNGIQLLKVELLGQTGDLSSAEAILKKLVEQNPHQFSYRKLLVNFYVTQHLTEDAEREIRTLVSANPADSSSVLDLVQFLLTIKRAPAEARKELDDRISAGGDIFPFQMALADLEFVEGNLAAGEQLLKQLIGNGGTSEQIQMARIALAREYLSRRVFDAAERVADDILHEDSHNVPALTLRAKTHLERSQPDAAVPDLVTALAYQPRSVDLMSLLATAYERSGLIELADKQFSDATTASVFDRHVALEYAAFLERHGSTARAEEILTGLIKTQPENVQVLRALAELRLADQNWRGAEETAMFVRRTGDSNTADWILGAALIGEGRYDDAIALLQKAYQATPNTPQFLGPMIAAFLKANRKSEAVVFLQSVLAKDPANADALVLLGSIELGDGETQRAIASFLSAIKAQPNDPVSYQALADLYRRQNNYDEEIRILRKGLQQQPSVTPLQMALASALEQKGDYEIAISEYGSILDKHPGDLIASNNLASLLLDYRSDAPGSVERAQTIAAVLRSSRVPQFKDTLGWVRYHQGDYGSAVSLCEEAVAALPDQAAVRYHLGMGYAALGRPDKASDQLKKAFELAPQGQLREVIRAALEKLHPQSPQSAKPS